MARLTVIKNGTEVQRVDLAKLDKGVLSIGRAEGADIRLDDRAIGREHAVLSFNARGMSVQKKTKFGRLSHNGVEVSQFVLKPGEVFGVADEYQIRFDDDLPAAEPRWPESAMPVPEAAVALGQAAEGVAQPFVEAPADGGPGIEIGEVSEGQPEGLVGESGDQAMADPNPSSGSQDVPGLDNGNSPVGTALIEVDAGRQGSGPVVDPAVDPAVGDLQSGPEFSAEGDKTAFATHAKIVSKLVFKPGEANFGEFVIRKAEVSIGRGTNCDIVIGDAKSSRKHLVIKKAGVSYVAVDLGSSNGTFVNGVKITQQELSGDDVIRIGTTEFVFKAENQEYFEQQGDFIPVTDEPVEPIGQLEAGDGLDLVLADTNPNMPFAGGAGLAGQNGQPGQAIDVIGGLDAIPGLSQTSPKKNETLVDKFKRQPLPRKILIVAVLGVVVFMAIGEDDKPKVDPNKAKGAKVEKGDAAFEALPPEKKQFVMNTYQLVTDLYKSSQLERAVYEAERILVILPSGYRDTKDIKDYANRTIERIKREEEEKRRKEAEEKLRNEVAQLVAKAQQLVDDRKDAEAKDVFAQVLERDPDNPTILRLRQTVEEREAKKKAEEEALADRESKRKLILDLLEKGKRLLNDGKYYETMALMQDAPVIHSGDPALLKQAEELSKLAKDTLKAKVAPLLAEGRASLDQGNFPAARDAFLRAIQIDNKNEEAAAGLEEVRETLAERSKAIYTEGVIAEGLSDYFTARAKFKECLGQAMPDDLYYGRCHRKYKRLEMLNRNATNASADDVSGVKGASVDPQKPVLPTDLVAPSEASANDAVPSNLSPTEEQKPDDTARPEAKTGDSKTADAKPDPKPDAKPDTKPDTKPEGTQ